MPMSKYQVSIMKVTEVTLFSMVMGKLQEDQINDSQCTSIKLPQFFSVMSNQKLLITFFLTKSDRN